MGKTIEKGFVIYYRKKGDLFFDNFVTSYSVADRADAIGRAKSEAIKHPDREYVVMTPIAAFVKGSGDCAHTGEQTINIEEV